MGEIEVETDFVVSSRVVTLAQTDQAGGQAGGLDFETPAALGEVQDTPAQLIPSATAGGTSVVLAVAVVLVAVGLTKKTFRYLSQKKEDMGPETMGLFKSRVWHILSMLVFFFLSLNVLFGGLSAFLLTGGDKEASVDYFLELSPFKVAKLSHQHFFGYGLLFGVASALALIFVGKQRRVLFAMYLGFLFTFLDVSTWWLSRFVSVGFHNLSIFSGTGFSIAFLILFLSTIKNNVQALLSGEN